MCCKTLQLEQTLFVVLQAVGFHRIMDCFGLEGTFRGHLVPPFCSEQGHLQLDQVAQSSIQPDHERSQGWGIDHLCGQPMPVLHHPHCKEFLA